MSCGVRQNRLLPTFSVGCKNALSDGRAFTNYSPNCVINQDIRMMANLKNSRDYRHFLQHNATSLMERERKMAYANSWNHCHCNADWQVYGYNLNN